MAEKETPFHRRLADHLMKEMGPEMVKKHLQLSEALEQNILRYEMEYGRNASAWPKGVLQRLLSETQGIKDTLMPKQFQKASEDLGDIEVAEEAADHPEAMLRKSFPDLVARMERGEVKRIEEPRAPVPQPQMPTPAPVKTREPPRPATPAPVQKPAEVKQPKTTVITGPSSLRQRERQLTPFEKAVTAQRDKWEKEGLFTPPPMQDIAKQRLLQMHDKEEEEVPMSLPEAVNPTAR